MSVNVGDVLEAQSPLLFSAASFAPECSFMDSPPCPSMSAPALLAPTAALLRGFDFSPKEGAPGRAPQARPDAPAKAQADRASMLETAAQSRQGFRIGALNLMISYTDASELADPPPLHRLPNAPHWFLGMSNLHGVLVPVFDLARWLGVERSASAKPMLLVLAHGINAAGIVVDGLLERLLWGREQLADASLVPDMLAEIAPRAVLLGEQLWFDLEVSALLNQLENELRDAIVTDRPLSTPPFSH